MDFFKRTLAPLTDRAWSEIAAEATRVLASTLTARRVVDVDGPKGLDFSAVNLGRLTVAEDNVLDGVRYGVRQVLPLVELRVSFDLSTWGLDDLERGARDVDTGPVVQAARKLALFEDRAVFHGFEGGSLRGLEHHADGAVPLGQGGASLLAGVTEGVLRLRGRGIGGPYAFVAGTDIHASIVKEPGYPLEKRIAALVGGPVMHSEAVKGAFLLATRGGDFVLTLGQDASLGFEYQDKGTARLYLTQTFTFQVLNPDAVVRFTP